MFNRQRIILGASMAVALLLAGCGVQPNALFGQSQTGQRLAVRGDAKADQLVQGLKTFGSQLKTFSGTVSFWETDGKEVSTSTAEIFLAQPGRIRANVTAASSGMKKGVKMVYLGDKKITVKKGILKKTFAYDDNDVLSLRGYRIDQTDLNALMRGVTHPQATARYLGAATMGGRQVEKIEVQSPALLPGTTREVVAIDAKTLAPVHMEAFAGQQSVYRMDLTDIQVNPTLSDDLFKL